MVNCCQVLRCLRAQHPLGSTSWLIWGGSTVCHSLADLSTWPSWKDRPTADRSQKNTMPHTVYNTTPNMKCVGSLYKQGSSRLFLNTHPFQRGKRGYYSCFRECTRCFSDFTFKLQGVTNWNHRQESKKNKGSFIRGRQFLKGFFFLMLACRRFTFTSP